MGLTLSKNDTTDHGLVPHSTQRIQTCVVPSNNRVGGVIPHDHPGAALLIVPPGAVLQGYHPQPLHTLKAVCARKE